MTLSEKAADILRWAILTGEISEDEELTERAICARLDMSRTPVRMALQTLANEGLLTYEAQRGHRIRTTSPRMIADAYQVRAELEGLACRLLMERGCPKALLADLRDCTAEGRSLLENEGKSFKHDQWRTMNTRFHGLILDGAENEALASALRHAERLPMSNLSVIASIGSTPDFELLQLAQRDHEQIVVSIERNQAQRASSRMREHIQFAGDLIVAQIERQLSAGQNKRQ